MALLDDVKEVLRENTIETEIQDLIDTAKADLKLSGVHSTKIVEEDPLIKRAIILYCKAQFGYDDPKIADRFQKSYTSLKQHLTLSAEYTEKATEVVIE
jgi:hypothetical protein